MTMSVRFFLSRDFSLLTDPLLGTFSQFLACRVLVILD